jgi:hypothetical protein
MHIDTREPSRQPKRDMRPSSFKSYPNIRESCAKVVYWYGLRRSALELGMSFGKLSKWCRRISEMPLDEVELVMVWASIRRKECEGNWPKIPTDPLADEWAEYVAYKDAKKK